ncbi:MAG: hypothetical protein DI623_15535 [Sphingomonas sanxanigenens]|uniref:NACHT domain-containing protein n=1 Tax=Sphingomonas sanxanigenens TaxID=397260 RepID=A0A2W5A027_9SPHN|nr:MAG: hypothetical protein DI623_15535 [Sphingomonas sanxanigenens]
MTAIAAVHLIDGSKIGWLDELADDTPTAIWAESGGPGDDVRLELQTATAELQAKRGLSANATLWEAMLDIARGLNGGRIDFGVLAVSPDSSRTVRHFLEQNLRHVGSGRTDRLHEVGRKWIAQLDEAGLDPVAISRAIRIQTVAATDGNVDAIRAAKSILTRLCGSAQMADLAWQTLVEGAHALIARKGRWDLLAVVRLLSAANVSLGGTNAPGTSIAKVIDWAKVSNQTFTVFGAGRPVSLDAAWISLSARSTDLAATPVDPAAAMARYRGIDATRSSQEREDLYDAEFLGWFKRRGVVVAGPGLGKSTLLRRQAQRYANEGYPVLRVQLRRIAAGLAAGETFETAILRQGLEGSGIDANRVANLGADGWVLLADGLDECGTAQEGVADALGRFNLGHPACRIIVTTRPIGYETTALADWPHYELIRPDSNGATAHVGRLVAAIAPEGSLSGDESRAAATAAFHRSQPANAIATDPQLLGMAASLIVRSEPLGRSRSELFQRLFSSIERSAATRVESSEIDLDICHAVLDRIGWRLTAEPLGTYEVILAQVSAEVATLLDTTQLAAARQARLATKFWEDIGLVERVHHRSTWLLAFVHKSFGEYAAGRLLAGMDTNRRAEELSRIADLPDWAEVLTFAASQGVAVEVIDMLLAKLEIERAVQIAADSIVDLSDENAQRLAKIAFSAIDSGGNQIKLGSALVGLAARYPAAVATEASARLASADGKVRRIAWACAVEAGPDYHDPDEAAEQAIAMLMREDPDVRSSLMGGIRLRTSGGVEIAPRMALTNLKLLVERWPSSDVEAHVEQLFREGNAGSIYFRQEVLRIVEPLGINPKAFKEHHSSLFEMMRPESAYNGAETKAVAGLLDGISQAIGMDTTDAAAVCLDLSLHPPLQLSGLLGIIRFWESPGNDVWAWTKSYSAEAVAELLRIVIALSSLDTARLAQEVQTIRRRLVEEKQVSFFGVLDGVQHVHIDDPEWARLAETVPNYSLVEGALEHESVWVVEVATAILAHSKLAPDHIARMLATASALGFASAGYLATRLPEPAGSTLILERLEGPHEIGMRHLFQTLQSAKIPWTARVAAVTERHLLGSSHWTATAAARFTSESVREGAKADPDMLWRAYRHWQVHEPKPTDDGAIPDSPRDALFAALLHREAVSDKALIEASRDSRHDVSKAAADRLLSVAGHDPAVVRLIGAGIATGSVGPHFLRSFLSLKPPLDRQTVDTIVRRLEDPEPRWRLAAAGVLRGDYLPPERIAHFTAILSNDRHIEIREAVASTIHL